MSVACCAGRYRHTNKFTIIFYDGIVSGGFTWECSFCLNFMYAKLRVQNKYHRINTAGFRINTAEIPQQDEGPEPHLSSSKKEETFPMGQCHHRNRDPAGAASPPVT